MKTNHQASHAEQNYSEETLRCCAALAALTQLTCAANRLRLHNEWPPFCAPTLKLELIGRQPFGFAFTPGHQAIFNVPSGHRLVIEDLNITCWAENPHLIVQLITKSPHMFRNLALCNSPEELNGGDAFSPIQIPGLTTNAFLFSNGTLHNSSTVPPDTYVRVCGYLEPTSCSDSF